jgi:hypothetical protein
MESKQILYCEVEVSFSHSCVLRPFNGLSYDWLLTEHERQSAERLHTVAVEIERPYITTFYKKQSRSLA